MNGLIRATRSTLRVTPRVIRRVIRAIGTREVLEGLVGEESPQALKDRGGDASELGLKPIYI